MTDSPSNQIDHLDDQLDRSVEQEYPQHFKGESGMYKVQLEDEDHTHEPQFQQAQHNDNLGRDSQFQQQGVFQYDDDYRMRQSMKSEQDFQLQDVSGNADMTDRKATQLKQAQNAIKIVQKYQQQEVVTYNHKINIQNVVSDALQQESKQVQQTNRSQNVETIQQPQIQNNGPEQIKNEMLQKTDKVIQTPKKQKEIIPVISNSKQQWSSTSNKSYSPQPKEDIYQSPKKQISSKVQVEAQKPKISFVKQNFALVQQPEQQKTTVSSIKDWFRAPSVKPSPIVSQKSQTPKKQINKQDEAKQRYRKQMQAQMMGVQQNLSKTSKASKLFGITDKQKQKHKLNKTHLPQPTSKKMISQTDQMNSEQYRMLLKISFQKKKQNYQMLKQWDKRRAQNMNIHRNMIELLQNQIDKRIKSSLQNFQIYTNFFKQKLKQEEKFINSPVINTRYALQNNSISKNIYINCSVILNSLSQQNQAKCKKIQDFIRLIKNNILKDQIDQHLHQSQKELLKVREKISTLKNSLKKYNSETQEKSEALATLFSQSAKNVSIKAQNDFYSVQLQFLRNAGQQILIQKRLGQNCLEYYHTALNEQLKRAKVIRESLLTYSKGLKQTYNIQLQDVELQQLSKSQQTHLIQQFYSLEDMLDQRNTQLLKTKFKIPDQNDVSINDVSKFVEGFEFQNFNSRMLLLKQFHAKYYAPGGNSKQSKSPRQQNCYIVITVDYYIHLFFSTQKNSINFKPDVSLKILAKQLQIKQQKQEFIDIIKKQQKRGSMISYFWDTKNQKSYRCKFVSKDAREEFCDYVRKLMT